MIDSSTLYQQLVAMQADAWTVGLKDALEQASWQAAAEVVSDIDWNTWQPGNPVAAALLRNTGFDQVLQQAGVTIRGIDAKLKQDIGDALAQALEDGSSVEQTANALDALLQNRTRADLIAVTEINRSMTEASLAAYRNSGFASWDLLTAVDPCPVCLKIKEANPHPLTDPVKPPIHPRCRCAVTAHVD